VKVKLKAVFSGLLLSAQCMMTYWEIRNRLSAVRCPSCRQQVTYFCTWFLQFIVKQCNVTFHALEMGRCIKNVVIYHRYWYHIDIGASDTALSIYHSDSDNWNMGNIGILDNDDKGALKLKDWKMTDHIAGGCHSHNPLSVGQSSSRSVLFHPCYLH